MGTSLRNPGQIVALLCDSASVLEGAALVRGAANDSVKLPTGANSRETFVGFALQAGSTSANKGLSVILNGVFPGIASGSITRGDKVVIAGATGTVASESLTTPPDAVRVGIALESVLTGERVAILIGVQPAGRGVVTAYVADGAITANTIVVAAGASKAKVAAGADPTKGVLGIALNTVADTETVYVCSQGVANLTDSGAGVTFADNIAVAGSTGLGKTAAPGAGTNSMCVGTALATTAASGTIPVAVNPFVFQG